MSKKMNKINYIAVIMLAFTSILSTVSPTGVFAQEEIEMSEMSISVYPEAISYNEQSVLTITVPDQVKVAEVSIDMSEAGGPEMVKIDPILKEHTIVIKDSTTAGIKKLPIMIGTESGEEWTMEAQIEVQTRELDGADDFDWDEAVIYFMLTDRFMDGDPSNNSPNGEVYDLNHPETYHGGDFQGIIDQLDYLGDLGINTIWITPIVDNVDHNHRHGKEGAQYGYHGYWAKDFTKIDEHLGDLETFKTLIDEAHDRGIKLMVDVVLNHTGYGMKSTDSGEAIPNFPTVEEQAVFEGMLRENPLNGHDVLGEIYGLPDFISEEEEVRNQMIEWQTNWIEQARTDRGDTIDYFRVDTIKHMEDTTWNAFKNELTKLQPDFKIIGESWGATYNNTGNYLNSGRMDSLLDFDFKRIASMFAHGNIEQAELELSKRNESLDNTATVGHFLSSHDEDGFLYYFMQGDEDLFKVAVSLQLTAKGQPVIYYGEEIGLSGKAEGDMDQGEFSENRPDFDWDLIEAHHLIEHYRKLLLSRQNHSKIFAKGNRDQLAGTNAEGYSVFSRSYEEETVIVALNTTTEDIETSFEVPIAAGENIYDEYNDVYYSVSDNQMVNISIPSYELGGTVILAVTDKESAPENNLEIILIAGGILVVAGGSIIIWRKQKNQKD